LRSFVSENKRTENPDEEMTLDDSLFSLGWQGKNERNQEKIARACVGCTIRECLEFSIDIGLTIQSGLPLECVNQVNSCWRQYVRDTTMMGIS
jgi:hypothetical protein